MLNSAATLDPDTEPVPLQEFADSKGSEDIHCTLTASARKQQRLQTHGVFNPIARQVRLRLHNLLQTQ